MCDAGDRRTRVPPYARYMSCGVFVHCGAARGGGVTPARLHIRVFGKFLTQNVIFFL